MAVCLSYFLLLFDNLRNFQKWREIQFRNRMHVKAKRIISEDHFVPLLSDSNPIISYLILFPWYNPMFPRKGQEEQPQLWKKWKT
jgi:hypothetical protein